MTEEFISYEQALALKELGFDERCFAHYNPNGVFFWKILCSDEDCDHTLSIKDILEHKADNYIEAPMYRQAFRWFEDKHNLFVNITTETNVNEIIGFNATIVSWKFSPINLGGFMIKETAEITCLDKLLELTKMKQ